MFTPKILVLFVVAVVAVLPAAVLAVRECPQLTPVPIDEKFLFDKQPKGGFHASVASGEDAVPAYTPKPVPPPKGAHKVCFTGEYSVGGKKRPSPPVPCFYDQPNYIMCDPKKAMGAEVAAAAGKKIPKVITGTIVDTDNSTYLAVGFCVDGAVYQWSFLTTVPDRKELPPTALEALHVTEEEVKEASAKKMKPGRGTLAKGDCLKKIVDADAQVQKIEGEIKGLGGLFNDGK